MKEDEFYSFIEEKIGNPEQKNKKKKFIKLLVFIGSAICFGAIASGVFVLLQTYVFNRNSTSSKIVLTQTSAPSTTPSVSSNSSRYNLARMDNLKQKLKSSLVTVSCNKDSVDFLSNPNVKSSDIYGVIVAKTSSEILILTDAKNTVQSSTVDISFMDSALVKSSVKSYDSDLRLAILSVEAKDIPEEIYDQLEAITFSRVSDLSVGCEVVLVGNPSGIVGSMDMCSVTTNNVYRYFTDGRVHLYYTDGVYSSKGEGIAVDLDGQVVGLITHEFDLTTDTESCKFMGISDIKSTIEKLVNAEDIPYVGIVGTDLANEVGVSSRVYVTEVKVKSPAYQAGIVASDEITKIGEKNIDSMASYYESIQSYKPGEKAVITVISNGGATKQVTVTLSSK